MKKSALGILAASLTLGISSPCLAGSNPYADVPHTDWSYTAVAQLINQGLVTGCSEDDYHNLKRLTRHDLSVYIAQAMSQKNNATPESKALIGRLAKEYAHELHIIGVEDDAIPVEAATTPKPKKTEIEEKLNRFNIFGWGRIRYDRGMPKGNTMAHPTGAGSSDSHTNVDLLYSYKLNDQWTYQAETQFGRNINENKGHWFTEMEKMFLEGHVNGMNIRVGRYDLPAPMSFVYDEKCNGVSVQFGKVLKTKLDFGKVVASDDDGIVESGINSEKYADADYTYHSPHIYSIRFDAPLSKATNISAGFYHLSGGQIWQLQNPKTQANFSSIAFDSKLNKKWSVYGVFGHSTTQGVPDRYLGITGSDHNCYMLKFTYGHSDFANPGSWSAYFLYRHSPMLASFSNTDDWIKNIEGFRIGGDYMFTKNMCVNTYYTFGRDIDTHNRDDAMRIQLNWLY